MAWHFTVYSTVYDHAGWAVAFVLLGGVVSGALFYSALAVRRYEAGMASIESSWYMAAIQTDSSTTEIEFPLLPWSLTRCSSSRARS